jgi:diguanylate cyclase (GGDEF)-like protein
MASQPPTNEQSARSFIPVVGIVSPPSAPPADGSIGQLNSLIQQVEAESAADARPAAVVGRPAENQLVEVRLGIASSLYRALRWKHEPTARHCFRVTLACSSWSTRMGFSPSEHDEIELAALLHDIGKVGVPDGIITKPGPLTPHETAIMDNHWLMGQEILRSSCASPAVLDIVAAAASWYDGRKTHLERTGPELPLAGRMLAIVDAFDAMMSDHVYRRAFSRERALNELYRCAGTQFDPELVKLFAETRDFDPLKLRETVGRRWLQVLEPEAAHAQWQYNEAASVMAAAQPVSVFQQRLVANMYDAVIFVDASLKIVEWNRGAERLTGVSGTSVYQRSWLPSIIELADEHGAEFGEHDCPVTFALRTGVQWLRRLKVRGRGNRQLAVDAHAIPVLCSDGITRGLALVLHDVSSEISLEARCENLKEKATKDPLTQVANRAEFDRVHAQFVAAHLENKLPCSLVISDIDRFKHVNDTYGHPAGDEVIQSFARLLKSSCRPGDLVARYGGEEFVLLCADCDNAAAVRRAEELRKAFSQVSQPALAGRRVTASFGVTEIQPGDTPETMLRRADRALLDAKESGRNRVVQLGSGPDHGGETALTTVLGPDGESVLAQRFLISEAPLAVCIEKARGFVSDHHGVIEMSKGNSLRVRVGQERGSFFRRLTDRPVALVMDLHFIDVESERHRPAHLRRYGNSRTRINLTIAPKRNRDRRQAQLQERVRQLVVSLRAYLMATEWELPSAPQPDAPD